MEPLPQRAGQPSRCAQRVAGGEEAGVDAGTGQFLVMALMILARYVPKEYM